MIFTGTIPGNLPLVALLLAACSPFLIASSANALTDGLTLTALAAGFWLALRKRPGYSGFLLGLALAAKHQALLALPLLLWAACRCAPSPWPALRRFGLSLMPCIVLLLLWDAARPGIGVHTLAIGNNDPGGLATIADLPGRLATWTAHAAQLFWPGWPGALLLLIAALPVLRLARAATLPSIRQKDCALVLFAGAYSLLHILPAIPLYGRYLLLAMPALYSLCARGLRIGLARIESVVILPGRSLRLLLLPILAALLLLQPPPGRDPHAGIDRLGAWLASRPVATVVYDRWLGWQLGYYLGVWHDKRLTWYPDPEPLARDALRLCEFGPRYFPAPADQDMKPWLRPLQEAGFAVNLAWQLDGYVAWQLNPPWQEETECPRPNQTAPD